MSLFSVLDTAASALAAQSVRLNVTASNMANANSASSSVDTTYRARHPMFSAMVDEFDAGTRANGVRVDGIIESSAPLRREYQPGHPLADGDGYVFMPNVNPVAEMANLISASRSYQTNVEVMDASRRMLERTLALGQR